MKYQYFVNMFKTVIESRVSGPRDRLILLIHHTYGEPKSIIVTCLYLELSIACTRARNLLHEYYGNPILTANVYIERLQQWPRISETDGKGICDFLVFLVKCQGALFDWLYINELNTNSLLQTLCIRLHLRMQRKWSDLVNSLLSKEHRRTEFPDFVQFIKQESVVANNPSFSREVLSTLFHTEPTMRSHSYSEKWFKTKIGLICSIICKL